MSVRGYALVIGNNGYVHHRWSRLGTAIFDALTVAKLLASLGYIVIEGYDVSLGQFQEKLRDFQRALPRSSKPPAILFFYSGHGVRVGDEDFLAPVDAQFEKGIVPE